MIPETHCREAVAADLPRLAALEAVAFADPWTAEMLAAELTNAGSLVLVAVAVAAGAGRDPGTRGPGHPAPGPGLLAPGTDLFAPGPGLPALLGYACFRQGGGEAELLRVAVEPAARRGGLARGLIAAGLARLRTAGVASCHLEVRTGNASALAVYRALGFTPAGRRRAYYRDGSDALVLRRDL